LTGATGQVSAKENVESYAFPLSVSQERIWAADCQEPGNPAYNASFRLRLQGPVDAALFEKVLREIVRRHEALRTIIGKVSDQAVQLVSSGAALPFQAADLRHLPQAERDAEVDRRCLEDACRPFDLTTGPLVRAGLLRVEDELFIFTLSLHHVICDGWSLGILLKEIEVLYAAFAAGQPSPLPDPGIQYADYIIWHQEWLKNTDLLPQLSYWRRKLKNYTPFRPPSDFPRRERDTFPGHIISLILPHELTDGLKQFNVRHGSTMFSTTLAAFVSVLARYSGSTDISLGSPTAGRDRAELEGIVGLFLNPVILRTDLADDPTLLQLVDRVRETVMDAFANRDIPYEHIVRALQPGVDPFASPFYRVNFVCQREYGRADSFAQEFAGIRMQSMPSKCAGALYDIQCFMVERGDGWRLSCEFNTDLYKEETARTVLQHFRETLETIVQSPSLRVSAVPLSGGVPALLPGEQKTATGVIRMAASLAQRRFWLLEQISANPAQLNMPASVRIRGLLDEAMLQTAVDELVRYHEVLRATFHTEQDSLWQVISPAGSIPVEIVSLEHLPDLEREAQTLHLLREAACRPFDLQTGPLAHITLFRLGPDDHVLQVTLHHIISDGWSQGMLQRQLWEVYAALAAGKSSPLPPLKLQYSDYTQWQQDWLAAGAAEPGLAYWKEKLREPLPELQVPTDRPPSRQPAISRSLHHALPAPLAQALHSFVKKESVTAFTVMLACFKALLFHYSGQSDILVGSPIANRNEDTEGILGPFAGPIALRSSVSSDRSFRDAVAQLAEVVLEAFSQKDVPFERILEEIDARPLTGRNPVFQFYFYYQNAFLQSQDIDGLKIKPLTTISMGTSFEIQLGFIERATGITAAMEFNSRLYDESTMRRLLDHFEDLLERALASPDLPLRELLAPLEATPLILPAPASAESKRDDSPRTLMSAPATAAADFVVPHDDVEVELVRMWQELFPNQQISVTANFFDMGGHSLLASRLLLRIESTFQKKLSMASLFEASTIQQLAVLLRTEARVKRSPLVLPIQPKGSKPAFYCVDAGPFFRPLAHHLGDDQPFFGLRLEDTHEFPSPFRLEDVAAYHIRNLREVQPEGPYYLGGWCLSGVIAYEMAQQLRAEGAVVPLVAMFDSPNPSYFRNLSAAENLKVKSSLIFQKLALHWNAYRQMEFPQGISYLWERVESVMMNHRRRFWRLSYWLQKKVRQTVGESLRNPLQVVFLASKTYTPKPYDGDAALFLGAAEPWGPYRDPNFGWAKLVRGSFEIEVMPGDHSDMFREPTASLLAQRLRTCIQSAEQRSHSERNLRQLRTTA
jgi:non-ribosomal peptide synthetase component F/thioesterase domain-containing protein